MPAWKSIEEMEFSQISMSNNWQKALLFSNMNLALMTPNQWHCIFLIKAISFNSPGFSVIAEEVPHLPEI